MSCLEVHLALTRLAAAGPQYGPECRSIAPDVGVERYRVKLLECEPGRAIRSVTMDA